MFQTFVSSQTIRFGTGRVAVASFSVLAHAGLITLAAVNSGPSAALVNPNVAIVPAEHLVFVTARELTTHMAARPSVSAAAKAPRAPRLVVPDLTKLQV